MFFPLSSSLCLCFWFSEFGGQLHFVQNEGGELLFWCIFPHISTIVPSPLMLPTCGIFWILFHYSCMWGLPLVHFSQRINHSFRIFIADPHHNTPHVFHDLCKQQEQIFLHPYFPCHITCSVLVPNTRLIFFVFFSLNNFTIIFSYLPVSAASMTRIHFHKRIRHTCRFQPLTFCPPRNIFTLEYHCVLPESHIC